MTKEQERQELHRAIWAIANELRGSVDGWDFKSYVLGFLFYRFISEDLANYINKGEWESGNNGLTCKLPWGGYPKSLHSLNMKNGRSDTPLS